MLLLGFFSWMLMGLAAGLLAARLFPGQPRLGTGLAISISLGGALLGGLGATFLGFGGLAGFDARSLLIATLGAALALMVTHFLRQPASGEAR